ncbi:MAG: hypothetical protein H6841_11170 [Planctomycetes bacterium]|nr:hypothetical protein [Planctomycetota bacterium]MCB9936382.1 hypothetical protein [Planctomycetota bacterium]
MGVPKEALETRHAVFDDQVESDGKRFTLRATLVKYDQPVCQCSAGFDDSTPEFQWSAGVTP